MDSQGWRPAMTRLAPTFRFNAIDHEYFLDGERVPHITGMLERTGWVDSTFMTEASRERGTAVHQLTAAYDLGALDLDSDGGGPLGISPWRGYYLAHRTAMQILRPEMLAVEQPCVHRSLRFAGTPDRILKLNGVRGVLEIKSGAPEKAHPIQCALQAILDAVEAHLPPEAIARWCLYLNARGKFRLIEHKNRADYDDAYRIIKACS